MTTNHSLYCDQNHTGRQGCNDSLAPAGWQPATPTRVDQTTSEPVGTPATNGDGTVWRGSGCNSGKHEACNNPSLCGCECHATAATPAGAPRAPADETIRSASPGVRGTFCGKCGAQAVYEEDTFCRGCGAGLVPMASPAREPSVEQLAKMLSSPLRVGGTALRHEPEPPAAPIARAPTFTARPTAPSVRSGRDGGNVAWGAFWGFLCWPSAFFMLRMRPGPNRQDRFFGYWMGLGAGLVIGPLVVLAAGVSSGTLTNTSTQAGARGDRVVGVMTRCEQGPTELSGNDCAANEPYVENVRLVVTVRSAAATTYTVDVPPGTRVAVGDTWPPTR